MKLKSLFAATLLVLVTVPSMASVIPLGSLTVPGGAVLGNTFYSPGAFEDQYTFDISSPADAGGLTLEFDNSIFLGIDLIGVQLIGSGGSIGYDGSPSLYSFNSLVSGAYTLSIFGNVTGYVPPSLSFLGGSVSYGGLLVLGRSYGAPASVPEPGTLALFGAGLVGIALTVRRRRVRNQ